MKKLLGIVVLGLLLNFNAYAAPDGKGEILPLSHFMCIPAALQCRPCPDMMVRRHPAPFFVNMCAPGHP